MSPARQERETTLLISSLGRGSTRILLGPANKDRHLGKVVSGRIHHIDITVSSLEDSTEFYDFCLTEMGFRRIGDVEEGPLWAGDGLEVGLQASKNDIRHSRYSPGLHHLAFWADSRDAVDALYKKLVKRNIEILDAPALYEEYTAGYYALFFADPDGIKLEYVYTPKWPV